MIWFYSFIGLSLVALFLPDTPTVTLVIRVIGGGGLLTWCCLDAEQQIRYVKQRFGKDYPRKSWWKPVGIASGIIVAGLLLLIVPAIVANGDDLGTDLPVGNSHLFYKQPVTETEARNLGNYLLSINVIKKDSKAFQITKSGHTYAFRYPVKKGIEQDQEKIAATKAFARLLSTNVFNGDEVDIHYCDHDWNTIRVVVP
jgi:hypothetical protein